MRTFWTTTYKVPSIPSILVLFLIVVFGAVSLVRGWDMAFGASDNYALAQQITDAINVRLWGSLLLAGAIYLLMALVLRVQGLVWSAHVFLCGVYVSISVMLLGGTWTATGDGAGNLAVPLAGMIWHAIFVWLSRPWGPANTGRERE